jgi:hypothetical protein
MAPKPLDAPVITTVFRSVVLFAYTVWPLTHRPGPARNATTSAMSSGWPRRCIGIICAIRSMTSSLLPSRNSGVATGPGATALTVMSRPASSLASTRLIASTAPLDAEYAA